MAFKREVIMNIRYRVDAYDEQHLFNDESFGLDANGSIIRSHVQLGSLNNIIHLSSYAKKLNKDIHLRDLRKLLTTFLRLNRIFDAKDNVISDFKVCMTCLFINRALMFVQVVPCHALRVTYASQETATKRVDLLHVTTSWRRSGERYDCAILQGSGPLGLVFCQVFAIFMVSIACKWHRLAIVRIYKRKRQNKITGYIELVAPEDGRFDLCFVESVVRIAHILPPTHHTTHSIVQDLYDGDMYLRLHHM